MADWITWWLAETPGWGAVRLRQLVERAGGESQILETMAASKGPEQYFEWIENGWKMTESGRLGQSLRIEPKDIQKLWHHQKQQKRCREDYLYWREKGLRFFSLLDAEYPRRLREIYDPPFALYVLGNVPSEERKTAAIIGARACTGYGAGQGRKIARELAGEGVQIISGLAYGVDSEGHWGALESGAQGATYAVLGSSVDQIYPPEHEKLAQRILEQGGGILSEYPPGTKPHPGHFPMRNRIISGLSDCILVMEARRRSGSLITVDQALEQGREVFALPGRVGDKLSEGCLHLIRNGANILTCSGDVVEYLNPDKIKSGEGYKENAKSNAKSGEIEEKCQEGYEWSAVDGSQGRITDPVEIVSERNLVYSCLDSMGKTVEEILEMTGLPLTSVQMQLLELLLEDQIVETVKGYYSVHL